MKNKITLIVFLFVVASISASATTYTVNNNNPSPGQYNNAAAAITVASSGDTILFAASPYSYNTITLNKSLTIIGSGFNPSTQNPQHTFCDYISVSANAGTIIGFEVQEVYTATNNVTNLKVIRNKITYLLYDAGQNGQNNWMIESNIFTSSYGASYAGVDFGNAAYVHDIVIRNNIFYGYGVGRIGNNYGPYASYNIYIQHNIFMGNQPAFLYHMYGTYYVNDNIFYGASPRTTAGGYSLGSPIFSNNISYNCYNNDTTFANGTNYVNQNPLFTNVSAVPVTAHSNSFNFALSNSSVGHNGASDATDVGVYGGTAIFNQKANSKSKKTK